MFKKLKDKLAEEVKSSPQRIQQFAQAAQAAVTSASSSISDITNTDLFSIGDNDTLQSRSNSNQLPQSQRNTFQEVSLVHPPAMDTSTESMDYIPSQELPTTDHQRQRRLSNSSFASDISFRLPSYESPSMYHLQSDMEVSASEADERGFSAGAVTLDRVSKEQIYAAYKRTQERYTKYRTQYADLARHYKLLERENAKAKSVLVETQDKALRRISELREQCALEQSAKAHLEKALRVDIEERNMKIETLNTKIQLLQNNTSDNQNSNLDNLNKNDIDAPLINLLDNDSKLQNEEPAVVDTSALNNKIEKLELLVNKYKDSLKTTKEKNAQITMELQILSNELENKSKETELLKATTEQLNNSKEKIRELNDHIEDLQNKVNSYEFNKCKELSTIEVDYQKAEEEIKQLRGKIEIYNKREEEYAISLAENKLSIHKELESKESEIKSLKDTLSATKQELQSLNIVISDYKNKLSLMEEEQSKLNNEMIEYKANKSKITDLESKIQSLAQKCQSLENLKIKADEEFKCLELQIKQETAEKLAMIDRNTYLESRNAQVIEENSKKNMQINNLETEILTLKKQISNNDKENEMLQEINIWKNKYSNLENEIQEEREELIKLQSEIEKLLRNHEMIQIQNSELNDAVITLKSDNCVLLEKIQSFEKLKTGCASLLHEVTSVKGMLNDIAEEAKSLKLNGNNEIVNIKESMSVMINKIGSLEEAENIKATYEHLEHDYNMGQAELKKVSEEIIKTSDALKLLEEENEVLKTKIKNKESELNDCVEKFDSLNNKYAMVSDQLQHSENDNQEMLKRIEQFEDKYHKIEEDIKIEVNEKTAITRKWQNIEQSYITSMAEIKKLEEEKILMQQDMESLKKENSNALVNLSDMKLQNEDLIDKTNNSKAELLLLQNEVISLKNEHETLISTYNAILKEREELQKKCRNIEVSNNIQSKMEETIQKLSQENNALKKESDRITSNIKDLEIEIIDVKKSHEQIEYEKDRLSGVIENLNKQHQDRINAIKDEETQTSEAKIELLDKAINTTIVKEGENPVVLDNNEKYDALSDDYNILKEENRRLQSDIAGLQSYLAKISKENSVLNDKLREVIASSDNSPHKNDGIAVKELQNEIKLSRDKVDEILRENTLLIDENLELKDQLNSQNYKPQQQLKKNTDELDESNLKEKYNNILETKHKLENKVKELEQINNSFDGNLMHVQENNEKLKLSNEKLERRLDEALVSLRHLHSLQENTELEYLRNILYEYLTGTGTHSITLAKVLAAVVKFDDKQTQQVILKEKERQGLLRQLGLL